jgi:hypothetical protein
LGFTHGTGSGLEALQLRQSLVLEDLLRDSTGLDEGSESLSSQVPEAVVLLVQQDDQAGGLGVEGAGNVGDGVVDELLDLGVRDGAVLAELVDSAAVLDRLQEAVGGHGGGGDGKVLGERG